MSAAVGHHLRVTGSHRARCSSLGLAFERKLLAALEPYGPTPQVRAGRGWADFVLARPAALVEAKRTLRVEALGQAKYYADALGLTCIVLVCQRLAAPPEAFGATEVKTSFDALDPGINVVLWR